MQSVIYSYITESDLLLLFKIGKNKLERFKKAGLPCESNGKFQLNKVCRWFKEYYQVKENKQIKPSSLDQQQLADLFGIHRHSISTWQRDRNFPRNKDDSYNLQKVCQWLKMYYRNNAEREYQKRLSTLQKKLYRNVRQLERYFSKENTILKGKKNAK